MAEQEFEITEEKFLAYEKVRQSGVTNMFDIHLVCQLSGFIRKECIHIMEQYEQLSKAFPEVVETEHLRKIGIVNLEGY